MIDFNHKSAMLCALKVPLHIVESRRRQLASWLQQQTYVPLQDVCKRFKISEATARRDLAVLAEEKQILRTYGGALSEYNARFTSFMERKQSAALAKRSIAAKARKLIKSKTTCFLDAGTTIYALAEEIHREPVEELVVVTNNMPVAELLAQTDGVHVHILGGHFLHRQSVLAGETARKALAFYRIDQAFLSAEGMTRDGLWNSQDEIVALQQRVMERASARIFCVDRTKLDRTAPSFLAPWSRIDLLATNATPAQLAASGIPTSKILK